MNDKCITREQIGKDIVFNFGTGEVKYDEVINLLDKWHAVFKDKGLKKGDKYTAHDWHSLEIMTLLIAGAEYGLQYYCVGSRDQFENPAKNFNPTDYGIKFLFMHSKSRVPCYWDIPQADLLSVHNYQPDPNVTINCSPTDIMIFGQTSGSTGKPKEFSHTHSSIVTAAKEAQRLYYASSDRVLLYTSFNHIGVITMQTIPVFMAGCYTIGQPTYFLCRRYLDDLVKFKPNKIMLFPDVAMDWFRSDLRWKTLKLDFVDEMITGGTILPYGFVSTFLDKGVKKIQNVYGLSEALPPVMVSTLTLDNLELMYEDEYVCNGSLVSMWEVTELENNILGIKGPSLAHAEWLEDNKINGFYNTQDIFYNKNGKYWCKGRFDKVKRINDTLVNLSNIERDILTDTRVKACKAFVEDNKLVIGINVSGLPQPEIDSIFTKINAQHAPYKITEIELRAEIEQIKALSKIKTN